jgi:hypothetical protein
VPKEVKSVTGRGRGRSQAPKELQKFIDVANGLANIEPREPEDMFGPALLKAAFRTQKAPDFREPEFDPKLDPNNESDHTVREWRQQSRQEQIRALANKATSEALTSKLQAQDGARVCKAVASRMPAVVRKFLGDPADAYGFIRNYMLLRPARELLQQIAGRGVSNARTMKEFRRARSSVLFSVQINVVVNESGQIEIAPPNDVLKALIGIHPEDIRKCAICGRIFWASRDTSAGCSPRHQSTLRQRRGRIKKTIYERNRRTRAADRKRRQEAGNELERWFGLPDRERVKSGSTLIGNLKELGLSEEDLLEMGLGRLDNKSGRFVDDTSRLFEQFGYQTALRWCRSKRPAGVTISAKVRTNN